MTKDGTALEVYDGTGDPVRDLAFEGWMLDRASTGQPCFSCASWRGPVVVLGYGQKPDDLDLAWCRARRIPVLRRLTGGTGVIHQGDLGLALALPVAHPWSRGVLALYDRFLDVLAATLRELGSAVDRKQDAQRAARVRSPICFFDQLSDTLLVDGRKAVGCAQTRRRGAVLIHAAILLGLDSGLYGRVFRTDPTRVREALAPAVPNGDWREIGHALGMAFAESLGVAPSAWTIPRLPEGYLELYRQRRWAPLGWP